MSLLRSAGLVLDSAARTAPPRFPPSAPAAASPRTPALDSPSPSPSPSPPHWHVSRPPALLRTAALHRHPSPASAPPAMKRRAKTTGPPLQQADFDALPDSVQRKCFSSLERLQIRHHARDDHHADQRSLSSRPSLSSRAPSSMTLCPSHADLEFFLGLPEKLRKVHYSREEQAVLLAKCEHAFLPLDRHLERAQQRFSDFQFGFTKDPYPPPASPDLYPPPASPDLYSPPASPDLSSPPASPDLSSPPASPRGPSPSPSFSQDASGSLFYLDIMSPTWSKRPTRPPNYRRTMSLSASPVQSSSAVLTAAPAAFGTVPAPTHQCAHSSTLSARTSSHPPTPPVFDPEATHYRDPAARKKLRTYLASPQMFDEAIEFGFPSTTAQDSLTPHYQLPPIASHSRKFSRDMHTFLRDGNLSLFEQLAMDNQGLESDQDSAPDMESPTTPLSIRHSFRLHSRQISHSNLSTDEQPSPLSPASGYLNREMTLRMTLTRPDLRADDDQLYGWQATPSLKHQKEDPLALQDLVFSDDMTGTKGPFYVKPKLRGNLVSRMLKRASFKPRAHD